MPSERVQRKIDQLLDEAEQAIDAGNWDLVQTRCRDVLALDAANEDAATYLAAAQTRMAEGVVGNEAVGSRQSAVDGETAARSPVGEDALSSRAPEIQQYPEPRTETTNAGAGDSVPSTTHDQRPTTIPKTFVNGRYEVVRFLGEGGKKLVYLARDKTLNREVAFALIKTEGLDDIGRQRILREGQAMGALGSHPHVVTVFDLGFLLPLPGLGEGRGEGPREGTPYMVTELMRGGDVEGLIEKAPEHRLPLTQALRIADEVCQGLEFAHAKGIVHRDLKPGNVWLTEGVGGRESGVGEGAAPTPHTPHPTPAVAKIGDFGLAISLDRSRLTQAGMMVGTVSYMPPEQATGGAVTPRSDLYSLGAMLYEMVAGRPPFLGADPVAIIGQHLNTSPVSPAWHRHDCPPGLEVLILRLLEKDPSRRPASATEVRQALAAVSLSVRDPSSPALLPLGEKGAVPFPTASAENPLYRRVFVGREAELRQLQTAFDAALSGQGGLVMVVGEPGIGKTALTEQLAAYASLRGGSTLWGHCYEEGSLSLPYLAFIEAIRSYVTARPAEALREQLGAAAGDLARIVSVVQERVEIAPSASGGPSEPEEDRWRLLQAVSGFLRNASTDQPLLIVLEDLHWADQGTLDLLTHLARNLQGARILVAGTYRDVEVDRAHPLSAALADLRRSTSFTRVQLRGLGTPEVLQMLLAITGRAVPGSLAEAIHRQTEGNPLFVQEVVRYLVEEGRLTAGGDAASSGAASSMSASVDMAIPEGLRDVIGRRIARLSPECNRLLAIAAVIGRDFNLATLRAVALVEEEPLVSAAEEATRVGVLEELSGRGIIRYRFAHAFFRQTLYEELSAPRRLRFHQDVARVLEAQYANRLEEHAAELAEHFAQSTDPGDLAKAVRYGGLAAERATAVYAYGEAVRHLEQALDVQEVLDPNDRAKRCDQLLALADVLLPAGEPRRAADTVCEEAFALATALGDRARAAHAARLAFDGLRLFGAGTIATSPEARRWAERFDACVEPDTRDRVIADGYLAFVARSGEGGWARAADLRRRALELARHLGDPETLFIAVHNELGAGLAPATAAGQFALVEEFSRRDAAGVTVRTHGLVLSSVALAYLQHGERGRWEELNRELNDLSERTQYSLLRLLPLQVEEWSALFDGRLEESLAAASRFIVRADELGSPVWGRQFASNVVAAALAHLGRYEEALAGLSAAAEAAGLDRLPAIARARSALLLAQLGRRDEARAILSEIIDETGREVEYLMVSPLAALLDAAVMLAHREAAATLSPALHAAGALITPQTCVARHLGAAAHLLGDFDQAGTYYEQALEVCGRMRFRPELALTHLGIAELLLDAGNGSRVSGHGGGAGADAMNRVPTPEESGSDAVSPTASVRSEAMRHLDLAIAEFREMKMQPSLERALRHKEVLKA